MGDITNVADGDANVFSHPYRGRTNGSRIYLLLHAKAERVKVLPASDGGNIDVHHLSSHLCLV